MALVLGLCLQVILQNTRDVGVFAAEGVEDDYNRASTQVSVMSTSTPILRS